MADKEAEILPEKMVPSAALMNAVKAAERTATDGKGPTPRKNDIPADDSGSDWEWDGTIDEEAHLGWD